MSAAPLAFGLQLPIQSQSTAFVQPWERDAGVGELVQVAQACEAADFDYVAVCDHVAIPADKAGTMSTEWWDTIATLSYLAAVTERVRLLSHVYVLAYRHPLVAAKAWATLDALSGGRAILGVGAGHVEGEFDALGVPFAERGRLLDEAIDAVRAAFDAEAPSHHGPSWSFDGLGARPRPVQEHLPIWVGGSSIPAMRRAAERGDGWLPQGPPEGGMADGIAYVRAKRETAGRTGPFTIGALSGPLYLGDPPPELGRCVRGSAEKIAGYLRTYRDLEVDQVQVGFVSRSAEELCDQIAGFAAEIAPLVND
ncbi:MAG: TIGR03619 family F420-dependent LLM class oxidoreductase [Actinomycetota bacterium]|nr:TIGR03619 family F420-dependent LLM class oxidoreductase [Actinomycetota bacterium]